MFWMIAGLLGLLVGWLFSELKKKPALIKVQTLLNKEKEEKGKLAEELSALQTKYLNVEKQLSELTTEIKNKQIWQDQFKEEKDKLKNELSVLQTKHLNAEKQLSELTTEIKNKQIWQDQFADRLKNLSQEILESKSKQFQIQAEKNLSTLLNPLKDKIHAFQTKVEETYDKESRERFSLKDKIKELSDVHDRLKTETQQLSQALKGDSKAQGQWGEVILSTLLEASGLKENEHYFTQGKSFNLTDEEGKRQKPDVIVKLPDKKHIVIDAKVSLTHYERFIASPQGATEEKQKYLRQFVKSLRAHVSQLHEKQYPRAQGGLDTPDFVLMFFPIEGAFSLALQSDPTLFQFSWDLSVVIVSPTTLLATLKTVESIWKREKQNHNALEIASASGRLYDKFISFIKDLTDLGSSLNKARENYDEAFRKLHTGKGNIVSKLQTIKQLGAKTSKQIPENLISSD